MDRDDDWLTIREASAVTGISATTLKKLARGNEIPSHLEKTGDGFLRIVSLEGVHRWARRDEDTDTADQATAVADPVGQVDLRDEAASGPEPKIPEGTMLVPLDAWNKMLNQLGNLHEAGQQLADARERAAKAETEARFLRERLRELRDQIEGSEPPTEPLEAPAPAGSDSALGSTRSLVKKVYKDWRKNRRR
jgi:hypothetical protein